MNKLLTLLAIVFITSTLSVSAADTDNSTDSLGKIVNIEFADASALNNSSNQPMLFIKDGKLFVSYVNKTSDDIEITFNKEAKVLYRVNLGSKTAISQAFALSGIKDGASLNVIVNSGSKTYKYDLQK
ncbi:hypothetical protein K5X82_12115 [Halosquirtibacter xylanolyticus]|uniref:hypothetical protein n=1 Tax=Halosquirtibacter xylanolyticus TaxID=3374599 RepID=UPI00374803F3|nr:hypothetical protein K5X82_12115 [Prolixibacteraceae bacterium]